MKRYYILLFVLVAACQSSKQKAPEQEWIQLFNGKDLTGWDIKLSGYKLNDN
jgi:hypothetical protein